MNTTVKEQSLIYNAFAASVGASGEAGKCVGTATTSPLWARPACRTTTRTAHRRDPWRVVAQSAALARPPPTYRQSSRRYYIEQAAGLTEKHKAKRLGYTSRSMTLAKKCRNVTVSTLARVSVGLDSRGLAMIAYHRTLDELVISKPARIIEDAQQSRASNAEANAHAL